MDFLHEGILNYAQNFTSKPNKILQELARETEYKVLMPRMISSQLMGSFLTMISTMIKPKYILEIGTYTGYSAICLSKGLIKDGELHTIEINAELEDFANKYFQKAKIEHKIKQHIGHALEIIPTINLSFDLIFIDADKKNYCKYYELAIQKLNKDGVILIDNVLWSGKVLEESKPNDHETRTIQKLNQMIANDKRVHNMLLPLRDGIMICKLL